MLENAQRDSIMRQKVDLVISKVRANHWGRGEWESTERHKHVHSARLGTSRKAKITRCTNEAGI